MDASSSNLRSSAAMTWLNNLRRADCGIALRALFGITALGACVFLNPAKAGVGVGVNKFDLAMQYVGTASGGDGSDAYLQVTVGMAKKALRDAQEAGVTYVRFAATGFRPTAFGTRGDLDLWRRDPAAYWARLDELMNDLDSHQI